MVNVGDRAKLVTAQSLRLRQGANDYHQVFNFKMGLTRPSNKKARTDGLLEKMDGLAEHYIEGDILLTSAEISTFLTMSLLSSRQLPENAWSFLATSRDLTPDAITFTAKLTGLEFIRPIKGLTLFHIRLEISSGEAA